MAALLKYEVILDFIQQRIHNRTLNAGDRLPSVRELSHQFKFSIITVQHAYAILQSDGIIEARPKSGFFVAQQTGSHTPLDIDVRPETSGPFSLQHLSEHRASFAAYASLFPKQDLYDRSQFNRCFRQVLRRAEHQVEWHAPPRGYHALREVIARRLSDRGANVNAADVIIANNGMGGLKLCLDALVPLGSTILVQTPSYLPVLLTLQRRDHLALEIYSHPRFGVDPTQFEHLISSYKVDACILTAVNHFPTGVTWSSSTMKRIADCAAERGIPLIELDIFADLNYDGRARTPLLAYDRSGNVTMFGSDINLVGADFGISWIVSKTYSEKILQQKYIENLVLGDQLLQVALAEYCKARSRERDARRTAASLARRVKENADLFDRYFPHNCAFTRPQGGFMGWLRGPSSLDAEAVVGAARRADLDVLPGALFSPSGGFRNCLGINLSSTWTEEAAALLGELLRPGSVRPRP